MLFALSPCVVSCVYNDVQYTSLFVIIRPYSVREVYNFPFWLKIE